jgi:glutamate-1-semialdehyde 2,1-aminomutase
MMNLMDGETFAALVAGGLALFLLAPRVRNRLMLSRAKHRSLAGHARMSRRIAGLVPRYVYEGDLFFRADDAGEAIAARRRTGFNALAVTLPARRATT